MHACECVLNGFGAPAQIDRWMGLSRHKWSVCFFFGNELTRTGSSHVTVSVRVYVLATINAQNVRQRTWHEIV